jgi:hypothetical protein
MTEKEYFRHIFKIVPFWRNRSLANICSAQSQCPELGGNYIWFAESFDGYIGEITNVLKLHGTIVGIRHVWGLEPHLLDLRGLLEIYHGANQIIGMV